MEVSDLADSDQIYALQKRLTEITDRMGVLVPAVGKARQIREFASDRRKRALAKAQVSYLGDGESAAAAEAKARASFTYGEEMQVQEKMLRLAEATLAEWDQLHCSFDAARTQISAQKEMVRLQ